ncbi:peptidoglycan-binding protein [bacterium]|nr:peptidoglycan-binding protein [bacterium]MBU1958064.1 peptidoglycan-binding protein [bacterium]
MKTNLMVFIAGDNDLDTFGTTDIEEMMSVSDTGDDLCILVQQDQSVLARDSGTKRFVIRHGIKEETLHLGETNTGDANTLTEFLQWGLENYDADRNIVVLWNHGGGTRDEEYGAYNNNETTIENISRVRLAPLRAGTAATIRAVNPNPTLANQASFFPQELRLKRIEGLMKAYKESRGEPATPLLEVEAKSILFDDESRDFLDNLELKRVFEDLGEKIDIVGFDACLMGMMEVAYQLKDHAEIVVGSEELEPGKGWDYAAIVSYLVNNPTASNEDISKEIIRSFIASYANQNSLKVTLSSIRTDKLDHVVCLMDRFAHSILRNESNVRGALLSIVDKTETFDYVNKEQIYRDLAHFVALTKAHYVNNPEIVSSADELLVGLNELIVDNKTKNFNNAHGLSVYLPLVPNMSGFAIAVFSALEINQADAAPHWLKLFKQIGNLDEEANNFYGTDPLPSCPQTESVDDDETSVEEEYPEADSNMEFTDLVEIPDNINEGLNGSKNRDLIKLLGLPKCQGTATTGKVEQRFKRRYKPLNFETNVNGFDLAVESFKEVLSEIEEVYPELAYALDTNGMAICRPVRGGQSYSNHSWGIAIDLTIDGKRDRRGNNLVQYGLTLIAPIFNKHGWYWGAGFTIEDAMHFEISQEKMYQWANEGRLFSAPTQEKPDNTVLRLGDRSPEVQLLQERLNNLGYDLIVDGIFGNGTYQAVYDFQITYGLEADGIVGSNTMTLIQSLSITRAVNVVERPKFTLTFGMQNRSVQIVQGYLNRYGFELVEDGVFDKLMLQAVLDYQKAYNLEETGMVDEAVWEKLENPTRTKSTLVRTYPVSSLGDENEEVYTLQIQLRDKGFDLLINGYYDISTKKAVEQLQVDNGLEPTGEVDSATREIIVD